MKKTFREFHLLKILESLDLEALALDSQLSQYFRKSKAIGSKDRKFIAETIYELIRWKGLIDHFCTAPLDWQERFETQKKLNIKKHLTDDSIPLHVRLSFPKSFFERVLCYFGEEQATAFCLASNTKAPTTLRVNAFKTTRTLLFQRWHGKYTLYPTTQSAWGFQVGERLNFNTLEEFKAGYFEVQDEASQLVANMVDPLPGEQVLDYCAGSGGKTLAFAHKLQGTGQIYLHDIRNKPLENAKKRLKRAGIENAQILKADAPHLEKLHNKMDWVLVDSPCSGSGTLRRNPDLKWKFSDEMLGRLIQEQREIFKNALAFLKQGGKIVYATCSILPEENEEQIEFFKQNFQVELVSSPFRSCPTEGGMDGFFGAVLQRVDR